MKQKFVDVSALDLAEVLMKLFNAAKSPGLARLHYRAEPMTIEQARACLAGGRREFDYLEGRVLKLDLRSPQVDVWGYDRDNGEGAMARILGLVECWREVG